MAVPPPPSAQAGLGMARTAWGAVVPLVGGADATRWWPPTARRPLRRRTTGP